MLRHLLMRFEALPQVAAEAVVYIFAIDTSAVLFTFPSRYWFTIGRQLVFRLTPWSAQIHTKFHVHRITQEIPRRAPVFGYGPFTLYGAAFQKLHLTFALPRRAPTTPSTFNRLRCSRNLPT